VIDIATMRHMLDRDRYVVAIALGHIKSALNGHRWLLEGRGPYDWDDDRYRDEFADWVQNVEAATGLLAKLAWDKDYCETDPDKVAAASEAARVYAIDPPVGHRTMLPSDLGLPCPSCSATTQALDGRGMMGGDYNLMMIRADIATGKATIRSLGALYMVAIANRHARGFLQDFKDINDAISDYRCPEGTRAEKAMSLEPVKKVAWDLYDGVCALANPPERGEGDKS